MRDDDGSGEGGYCGLVRNAQILHIIILYIQSIEREKPKMTVRMTGGVKLPSVEFGKATGGEGREISCLIVKSLVSHRLRLGSL